MSPIDPRNRPTALWTQEVPEIPHAIFERLFCYQNVRSASFCGWAPDGQGILIRTRFANADQLHRVYQPGGRREQMTFYDEPVTGFFLPKRQDGALLLHIGSGGNENYQLYRFDGKSPATLLTDGTSRNVLNSVSADGTRVLVSSNRRHPRNMDVYLTSTEDGVSELLMQVDNQDWLVHDLSQDGAWVLLARYVALRETYPALLEVATGRLTSFPALEGSRGKSFGQMCFATTGRTAYATSDVQGEFLELLEIDLQDFSYQSLTADLPWDVVSIRVDHQSGRLAFVLNQEGASRLFLVEGGKRTEVQLPLGLVSDLEFSGDSLHLGFTLARSDAPPDVHSVRIEDGSLTRWTFSEVGGLDARQFITPQLIRFPSFDGRLIPAYYARPRGCSPQKPAAVVIQIHGGPESQYRPNFSANEQFYLNELGLAVIGPNVRGSNGYGMTYLGLDDTWKREDSVRDIGALLDWIAQQPELDATRVAVSGGSYGGYMVLASLIHFGDRLRAGLDRVGIANFVTFLERTGEYRKDMRRSEYGDERDPAMREFLEKISPTARAHEIRSALLIAHGANDPRVPLYEAEQIAAKVRANGREVWTLIAQNEGHSFARKDNTDYLTAASVLFLQKHLLT